MSFDTLYFFIPTKDIKNELSDALETEKFNHNETIYFLGKDNLFFIHASKIPPTRKILIFLTMNYLRERGNAERYINYINNEKTTILSQFVNTIL